MIDDPLWYKDAVIYQLHVRAFCDSDGNGTGDFRGLAERLEYLQDLGVTALWLLPFYPSPLRDDGYDIADYRGINPDYGTLSDFKAFLQEAHARDLRVITELVINHTSDQHPWFQAARRAPANSKRRNFYVWSDDPEKYKEARIIFKDFEGSNWNWDPIAKAYYWHRFYAHQPDLNFENAAVRREIKRVLDFWLRMGVDGMRLDAVPYLYERDGTNCENLPETHDVLKDLRKHVDARYKNRMLLAEANQWPEDAIAYFGEGSECHMAFHFPLMPRMYMALSMEDRFPIMDILDQTPAIAESCQWALFLRNHDELTLEMVTDEERDYMYRAYAHDRRMRINLGIRRRLAPLLGNNRRKIELMNALLFSLPGTPVIYYGDEIGMGDNVYLGDRDGVRTPFQWSPDRNAGFSKSNPQRLYMPVVVDPEYHFEAINVEVQRQNPQSLLWWMKRLVALRQRYRSFGRGTLDFLYPENRHVLAFVRRYEEECILFVANLSRFVQRVELDLREFLGLEPIELFGRTVFPAITEQPYFLTLGPHSFYWFALEPARVEEIITSSDARRPQLSLEGNLQELLRNDTRKLEGVISRYLPRCRWFGGKSRSIAKVSLLDVIPIVSDAYLTFLRAEYTQGAAETFVLPIALAVGESAGAVEEQFPATVIADVYDKPKGEQRRGILYDAVADETFNRAVLHTVLRNRRLKGRTGRLLGSAFRLLKKNGKKPDDYPKPTILSAEQSNTCVFFGDQVIMKIFRRLEEGLNPDLEIGRFLTEQTGFANTPQVGGTIQYEPGKGEVQTVSIVHGFVQNEGNAWDYTLDHLWSFFERVLTWEGEGESLELPETTLLESAQLELPETAEELIGPFVGSAMILGRRTAEMHAALASARNGEHMVPESFSTLYQRSLYQSMRNQAQRVLEDLGKARRLPERTAELVKQVLDAKNEILQRFRTVVNKPIKGMRIRCHGDYHLGQVLSTGADFVIIDFEGEPARPISERRIKRSPLRDVAGMLRSFHYAGQTAMSAAITDGMISQEGLEAARHCVRFWYAWVSAAFLSSYLEVAKEAGFLPTSRKNTEILLDAYLLEKALYETGYELNSRPEWLDIPLEGVLEILQTSRSTA